MTRAHIAILCITLIAYAQGRLCQLFADRLPTLLVVLLHVVPPALFALVHGRILYGLRGIAVFTLTCLGTGALTESLSLRTGFPFGHYVFTDVMGPKVMGLPILLVLAYLGIGYAAWIMALLIMKSDMTRLAGTRLVTVPLLAGFIMLAWDLSMEADWATVDRAWIWRDGGAWFGVPLSNFAGWFLTAWLFFQIFALTRRRHAANGDPGSSFFRISPVLLYAICAAGNLLILAKPMAPAIVTDASGTHWNTLSVLLADSLVSIFLMGPIALFGWARSPRAVACISTVAATD